MEKSVDFAPGQSASQRRIDCEEILVKKNHCVTATNPLARPHFL